MSSKRKSSASDASTSPQKKIKQEVPEYHLTLSVRESDGQVQWPAPRSQIDQARSIIQECANQQKRTLLVPDKDADGLSAVAILRNTLLYLGLREDLIEVHLLEKGNTIHSQKERERMGTHNPDYIFVVDHGSRAGPPIIDAPHTALVIDHHHATSKDFPKDSYHVTACDSPPVATSSLLTFELCKALHPDVQEQSSWLCVIGTHGDLGNTIKWEPPFPDMRVTFKRYTKKMLNDIVSLVNASRRTARYNVRAAWNALGLTTEPATVLKNEELLAARAEVNAEVERCTHTAPKFTPDGKVAVFRINSAAQVHPVIATRWAGHLQSKALEMVMVANEGYLQDKINFSCRIPRCARAREIPISIIERLKYYASLPDPGLDEEREKIDTPQESKSPLIERLGDDFARGHVQASGGIVSVEHFEELMRIMQVGVKPSNKTGDNASPRKSKRDIIDPSQKNTLMSYFPKKPDTSVKL